MKKDVSTVDGGIDVSIKEKVIHYWRKVTGNNIYIYIRKKMLI